MCLVVPDWRYVAFASSCVDLGGPPVSVDATVPRWVWSRELFELLDGEMRASGATTAALARRAAERFGSDPESIERRLRASRRADTVTDVHTADRLLCLIGRHLTDLPTYRAALAGELDREDWPRRGTHPSPPRAASLH